MGVLNTVQVYAMSIHIPLALLPKKQSLWSLSACKHHTTICIIFMSMFSVSNIIWRTFYHLTQLWRFNLNHFFWFDSTFLIWLNFHQSTLLISYNSIWLNFPFWFEYRYIHLNHNSYFESDFLIQLKSSLTIW